jgi:hypothetical protein
MNRNEAMQHALGFADGRETGTGTATAISPAYPHTSGFYAFAEAYAQGWDDYSRQHRSSMTSCRDAYAKWQETGGRTIFSKGDLTLSEADRAELNRERPGAFATTEQFTAYWELRERMQDQAWHELFATA